MNKVQEVIKMQRQIQDEYDVKRNEYERKIEEVRQQEQALKDRIKEIEQEVNEMTRKQKVLRAEISELGYTFFKQIKNSQLIHDKEVEIEDLYDVMRKKHDEMFAIEDELKTFPEKYKNVK